MPKPTLTRAFGYGFEITRTPSGFSIAVEYEDDFTLVLEFSEPMSDNIKEAINTGFDYYHDQIELN